MIIKKITVGFVVQTFDTETGKYVSQDFVAGDQVDYETEKQNINGAFLDDKNNVLDDVCSKMPFPEPYLPFNMVQPNFPEIKKQT